MATWSGGTGVPGGGLPAGAATSMTNLGTESNPVWGWAGAERVNSHMAAAMPGPPVAAKKVQPCDEIVDKLFLGSKACASTTGELKKRNIELTIGVGDRLKLASDEVMREDFQFEDEEAGSLLPHFPKAFKKIRQGLEDGGVLVYCETGQASVALVAAFLMAEQGMTYEEATGLIAEKRAGQQTDLNRNLARQLKTWAKWPEFPGLPEWM